MTVRRGILLLEVSVAITLTAAILYGAVALFSMFQRIDRTARLRVQRNRELQRLTEQFRDDVYAARDVELFKEGGTDVASDTPLARLQLEKDGRVDYTIGKNGQLARTVYDGSSRIEREAYDFGPGAGFSVEAGRNGGSLVTMVVAIGRNDDREDLAVKRERRITALVSRDHRYGLVSTEKQSNER